MANGIINIVEEKIAGKNPAIVYLNKDNQETFVIRREIRKYYRHKNVKVKINPECPSQYIIKIKKSMAPCPKGHGLNALGFWDTENRNIHLQSKDCSFLFSL